MVRLAEIEWAGYRGTPSPEIIREFESALGMPLPLSFRRCIENYNEGTPSHRFFLYRDPQLDKERTSSFIKLFSFSHQMVSNVVHNIHFPLDDRPESLIPFARAGNRDLLCFRRYTEEVVYWILQNQPGTNEVELADTFKHFMESMEYDQNFRTFSKNLNLS
ncbi:Hypothetical protein PBC10988_21740 [Planctomycetales bacterium 10988]|nr:Hypothetical protein PBC10988_21740 [Planctomycetales bacterium 10988]